MFKILILIVLLIAIYFIFFKKFRVNKKTDDKNSDSKVEENIMVECKKCGTYVSQKEAIISNSGYYCSDECLIDKK